MVKTGGKKKGETGILELGTTSEMIFIQYSHFTLQKTETGL